MTRFATALCAAVLLALAFVACGDGDEGSRGRASTATATATATETETATDVATEAPSGAGAGSDAAPSDAGTPVATAEAGTPSPEAAAVDGDTLPLPDSIRALLERVAAMRRLEAPETMRALTLARSDVRETVVDLYTAEDRQLIDDMTKLYRLLGYLDEDEHLWDIALSFLESARGFYSPDEKTLWVVTEREGVGLAELSRRQRQTLVHEMLHVLQDYHFDIGATSDALAENLDADLAFTSVVEGDAVVHTGEYARRFLTIPAGGGLYLLASAAQLSDIPPPILRALYFPYTAGAEWAEYVLRTGGVEALNGYLAKPPPASTLILRPELAEAGWQPEPVQDFLPPAEDLAASLGTGWQSLLSGSLGEFHLINYLVGDAHAFPGWLRDPRNLGAIHAARGWAGDRYELLGNGEGEAVVVARVRFTDGEDALEFAREHREVATLGAEVVEQGDLLLASRGDGNVVALLEPVGRDVLFAIGTSAEVVRAALEPLIEA